MVAQKETGFESPPWSWQLECGGGPAWGPARATAPPGHREAAGRERRAQAPGCKWAGFLPCEDGGPLPQFLPGGEAEEASVGGFGGLRASGILLQALRGLGHTSGCSRQGRERGAGRGRSAGPWGPQTPRVPWPRGRPAPAPLPGSSVPTGLGTGPGGWGLGPPEWALGKPSREQKKTQGGRGAGDYALVTWRPGRPSAARAEHAGCPQARSSAGTSAGSSDLTCCCRKSQGSETPLLSFPLLGVLACPGRLPILWARLVGPCYEHPVVLHGLLSPTSGDTAALGRHSAPSRPRESSH